MFKSLMILSLFGILFNKKPSDDPETAHLILQLQNYSRIDSVEVYENLQTELRKAGQPAVKRSDRRILVAKSKSGIKKVSKTLIGALVYPPDDILLCIDLVGYVVVHGGQISDTIIIDDGAKILRHKINGEVKYSYYQGNIWKNLTSNKVHSDGCKDRGN